MPQADVVEGEWQNATALNSPDEPESFKTRGAQPSRTVWPRREVRKQPDVLIHAITLTNHPIALGILTL